MAVHYRVRIMLEPIEGQPPISYGMDTTDSVKAWRTAMYAAWFASIVPYPAAASAMMNESGTIRLLTYSRVGGWMVMQ